MVAIVEDDRALLSALAFVLEAEGVAVRAHADAESALRSGDLGRADCLVIDHRLPGLDGLSLLARLRAENLSTPAFIITSNPDARCKARAAAANAEIIEKPLMNDALTAAVLKTLGADGAA